MYLGGGSGCCVSSLSIMPSIAKHVLPCRSKDHFNPLYVKPTDLDDVDKGAVTQSAPPISEAGGESGAEPVSNGSE